MIAAGLMLLIGIAMITMGPLVHTLYDIGVVVVVIAGIGLAVKAGEWLRLLRE
jgi:hypothetical protein